jgi:hypothetical protein
MKRFVAIIVAGGLLAACGGATADTALPSKLSVAPSTTGTSSTTPTTTVTLPTTTTAPTTTAALVATKGSFISAAYEIGDIVLRVSHNSGKPTIRFNRSRQSDIPDGETEFTANGRTHTGKFVKIALNVASTPGGRNSSLRGLLRGWFGGRKPA